LSDGDEENIYEVVPKLWLVAEELSFLSDVFCNMLQPDESMSFSKHFYHHEPREALILDERMDMTIKNKPIVEWTLIEEEQLTKLNLGNKQNPKMVFIDAISLSKFVLKKLKCCYKHCYRIIRIC
jgi:hypothetical protein